ncbi:MAG: hypothetical protein R3E77_06645 [Steroidobacteraceae bacterium]
MPRKTFHSLAHAVFAATMIFLGATSLIQGDLAPIWIGAATDTPRHGALVYLSGGFALAGGLGLLWRQTASHAARLLLAFLLFWLVAFKAPFILRAPLQEVSYQSFAMTSVIVAGAWVLYAQLATGWERRRVSFVTGESGVRIARLLYGLSLLAFGLSHFFYLNMTAPLVPSWLGWQVGWAYFTGCTYLVAGVAILVRVMDRLAAVLSAIQMGLFLPLVWLPIAIAGQLSAFQRIETVDTWVLAVSAWVVAESYRGADWGIDALRHS